LYYAREIDTFFQKAVSISDTGKNQFPIPIKKRQTSLGYIIRILQNFATKLRNITNLVMLFEAVMKFLSRLV
jgi:hypothetical protein